MPEPTPLPALPPKWSSSGARDREGLELALRQALDEDCAVDAAFRVIEAGWRSPAEVAALEAENAALAEALTAATHPHQDGWHWADRHRGVTCARPADDPAHDTPDVVRRRLTEEE